METSIKKGKQKIEIKPIISKSRRCVTFSKRRAGLFKKARELNAMCGAEVAVITFSTGGKLFCSGHPNSDELIRRYLNCDINSSKNPLSEEVNRGTIAVKLGSFSDQNKEFQTQIIPEIKTLTKIDDQNSGYWWGRPVDDMALADLEQFKVALEGLRDEVISMIGLSSMLNPNMVPAQNCNFGSTDFQSNLGCQVYDSKFTRKDEILSPSSGFGSPNFQSNHGIPDYDSNSTRNDGILSPSSVLGFPDFQSNLGVQEYDSNSTRNDGIFSPSSVLGSPNFQNNLGIPDYDSNSTRNDGILSPSSVFGFPNFQSNLGVQVYDSNSTRSYGIIPPSSGDFQSNLGVQVYDSNLTGEDIILSPSSGFGSPDFQSSNLAEVYDSNSTRKDGILSPSSAFGWVDEMFSVADLDFYDEYAWNNVTLDDDHGLAGDSLPEMLMN